MNKKLKKTMNLIQNDNQNVDGVDQHPKAWLLFIVTSSLVNILFHKFTYISVFLCVEILYRRCVLAPPTI